jgi:YD repeat-containing protein
MQATDPAGGVTRYGYDAAGNLAQVTDPRGLATTYAYDSSRCRPANESGTGVTTQAYDAAGNATLRIDARGVTAVSTFDALNRVTAWISAPRRFAGCARFSTTAVPCFKREGRLTKVSDPSGRCRGVPPRPVVQKTQQGGNATLPSTTRTTRPVNGPG